MNAIKDDQATFEFVGFGYTLEEATQLMHQEVMFKKDLNEPKTLQNTGLVSGILHVNEEIELVIQFYDKLAQFTQAEFDENLTVITDDK